LSHPVRHVLCVCQDARCPNPPGFKASRFPLRTAFRACARPLNVIGLDGSYDMVRSAKQNALKPNSSSPMESRKDLKDVLIKFEIPTIESFDKLCL
jgi:hypothetical protein